MFCSTLSFAQYVCDDVYNIYVFGVLFTTSDEIGQLTTHTHTHNLAHKIIWASNSQNICNAISYRIKMINMCNDRDEAMSILYAFKLL